MRKAMVQWIDCNGSMVPSSGNCEKRPGLSAFHRRKSTNRWSEWSFLDLKWSKFQSFLVFRFTKISNIPGILVPVTWRAPGKSLPISPHELHRGTFRERFIGTERTVGTVGNAVLIYLSMVGFFLMEASISDSKNQSTNPLLQSTYNPPSLYESANGNLGHLWMTHRWNLLGVASTNHFGHLEFTSVVRTFDMWPVRAKRKTHSNKSGSRSKNSRPS